jgi:DNA-binding transcriptional ArsR family regulator
LQSERDAVGDFFKTSSHPVRREMIRLLYERIDLSYTELLNEPKIDEGQLNFHLRAMKVLLDHSGDGRYKLNNIGKAAYHVIKDITGILGAADYLELISKFRILGVWLLMLLLFGLCMLILASHTL